MVSIIIVNYNRKDLLKNCLDSIRGQSFQDIEVIVVDNASQDDSVGMLRTYYPEVKLIWNTANLLFCKAQNQGMEASKGGFVLSLNSDCILDKGYLKEALQAMGLGPKIGMVSGKILRMDKKTIDSTGLFLGRNRKAIERGYGKIDKGQYDTPEYVFGVSGACAFFRRSMLKDVKDGYGYFDERFGMYYEDLDLCWRANKKGWKAYYDPKAIAYHVRAATAIAEQRHCEHIRFAQCKLREAIYKDCFGLRPRNDRLFCNLSEGLKKRYIRNRYRCMKKNDSFLGIIINLPFIIWYEIKIYGFMVLDYASRAGSELRSNNIIISCIF